MATQSTPQLVKLSEVADSLGVPAGKVETMAGKRAAEWFDGSLAVTLDDAKRIFEAVRAEQAASDADYIASFEAEEKAVRDQLAEAQRQAAERERERPTRIGGVSVTVPPADPDWMSE